MNRNTDLFIRYLFYWSGIFISFNLIIAVLSEAIMPWYFAVPIISAFYFIIMAVVRWEGYMEGK